MPWKPVADYRLGYSVPSKQFYFYFTLAGESSTHQLFLTADEALTLADMFRNEGPISFETEKRYFVSGAEPVGEGETSP